MTLPNEYIHYRRDAVKHYQLRIGRDYLLLNVLYIN